MTVVTRFPPSPTGSLHIGSARTALFNWLYARHHNGRFILRIEDTDKKRSTKEAVESIFDGLNWLALNWDGDTTFQSHNLDRHAQVAEELLASGMAYKCYCTPEELEKMRSSAKAEGKLVFYNRQWRDKSEDEAPEGIPGVVRIKMPIDGKTTIHDLVQGDVTVAHEQLDDFILLRSDGSPTYMLSVVVDDYDAGVTHVIRGDDHLNNAFRQYHLYRAAGWGPPEYAHIPLIHGSDGQKLSKRHGAASVQEYRDIGFLSEALRNYLLRLGWSHGDDEIIDTVQAIEWFGLENVGRSASKFDSNKLENLNAHYLRETDAKKITSAIVDRLCASEGINVDATGEKRIEAAVPHIVQRAKTLIDLSASALFLVAAPTFPLAEAKAKNILKTGGIDVLVSIVETLRLISDWTLENLDVGLRSRARELELGFGKLAQPLRIALTGSTESPGIFDVMVILGRDESLSRVSSLLEFESE
jgi:glutamyl-tRNA synthetase